MGLTRHKWVFRARFRRGAFGWRSQPAITRVREAVREIKKAAKTDPLLGAEGAVLFLEKVSGALEHVDSSSGAVGTAVNNAIETLVPIITAAPADDTLRQRWLERLYQAHENDQIPYIETLTDHWGDLCASPDIASHWADALIGLTRHVLTEAGPGAHFHGATACLSALHAAGRYPELLDLLSDVKLWHYRIWAVRAMAATGQHAEAIAMAEASRNPWSSDISIDRTCEKILLAVGKVDEAYRYGRRAHRAHTYLAWYRNVAKCYPHVSPEQLLEDLVAETPGEDGKWFAAAKSVGLFDQAIALARRAPTAPQTLIRAARDHADTKPVFAIEAGLAALTWIARGHGYEISDSDIREAHEHTMTAANNAGIAEKARLQIEVIANSAEPMAPRMRAELTRRFVR